jgi:hypothetical protein
VAPRFPACLVARSPGRIDEVNLIIATNTLLFHHTDVVSAFKAAQLAFARQMPNRASRHGVWTRSPPNQGNEVQLRFHLEHPPIRPRDPALTIGATCNACPRIRGHRQLLAGPR